MRMLSIIETMYFTSDELATIGFERRHQLIDANISALRHARIDRGIPYPAIVAQDKNKPYSCIVFYLNDHGLLSIDDHIDYFDQGVTFA